MPGELETLGSFNCDLNFKEVDKRFMKLEL